MSALVNGSWVISMRSIVLSIFLAVSGCKDSTSVIDGEYADSQEPVLTEAVMQLSEAEIAELKSRGEGGDLHATNKLMSYYAINFGGDSDEALYWEVHSARLGSCRYWSNLMFLIIEDNEPAPLKYLRGSETMESIRIANKCPEYVKVKNLPKK